MKLKRLFSVIGLGLFAAVSAGAGVALSSKPNSKSANAEHPIDYGNSGTIYLRLDTGDWKYSGSKICLYMFDNSESKKAWGDFVTPNGTDTYVEYSYNLDFTPTGCIAWRLDPGVETVGDWCFDDDRSNSAIWSTTNDIDFNQVIWLGNYYTSSKWTESGSFGLNAVVMGGATDSWSIATVDVPLTTAKASGTNLEVYGTVSLPANTFFKVLKTGSEWCGTYEAYSSIASNLETSAGEGNIHNFAAATYVIYFNYESKAIYITDPVVSAADEWSQYFLSHVGCDATGVNLPTGWTDCATEYDKLSNDVKDYIYGATAKEDGTYTEHAVKRYDVAVTHHSSLTRFIVNSGDTPRAALATNIVGTNSSTIKVETSTMIAVISIIAIVSISSIVVLVVIKKRKHD